MSPGQYNYYMQSAPNTSFIPKRGPVKRNRQTASRQVHLFSIFSYLLFSTTLVATVGVFFYSRYIDDIRAEEITSLNGAISSFDESKMTQLLEFSLRLKQADYRLQNSVSMVSIFDALEAATVQSVKLIDLTIERDLDNQFNLTANVEADSFDSTLFQRGVFERNKVIESVEISKLEIGAGEDAPAASSSQEPPSGVSFVAKLGIPVKSVPYNPSTAAIVIPETEITPAADTDESTSTAAVADDNQNQP